MSETENNTRPQIMTLKDLLDDYQKSIAVAGVFLAMGLFSQNVLENAHSFEIPSLCFSLALLVFGTIAFDVRRVPLRADLVMFGAMFGALLAALLSQLIFSHPKEVMSIVKILIVSGLTAMWYSKSTKWFNAEIKELEQLELSSSQKIDLNDELSDQKKSAIRLRIAKKCGRRKKLAKAAWWSSLLFIMFFLTLLLNEVQELLLGWLYLSSPMPEVPQIELNS